MEFKPMGNRILLKRYEPETKTQSGILLPNANKNDKPAMGKIISISDKVQKENSLVKVGSLVAFKEFKVDEIKLNNEEFLVVDLDDVLGIVLE